MQELTAHTRLVDEVEGAVVGAVAERGEDRLEAGGGGEAGGVHHGVVPSPAWSCGALFASILKMRPMQSAH